MTNNELLWKIYDALNFICRPFGLPKRVITEAAEAAAKVIRQHTNNYNSEHYEEAATQERKA